MHFGLCEMGRAMRNWLMLLDDVSENREYYVWEIIEGIHFFITREIIDIFELYE